MFTFFDKPHNNKQNLQSLARIFICHILVFKMLLLIFISSNFPCIPVYHIKTVNTKKLPFFLWLIIVFIQYLWLLTTFLTNKIFSCLTSLTRIYYIAHTPILYNVLFFFLSKIKSIQKKSILCVHKILLLVLSFKSTQYNFC